MFVDRDGFEVHKLSPPPPSPPLPPPKKKNESNILPSCVHATHATNNMGMQGVQDFFEGIKCPWRCNARWTLSNYDRLIQQVCLVMMASEKKNRKRKEFVTHYEMWYQAYFYQGVILKIDQWLHLLELHGTVPSKTAKHQAVCNS